MPPNPAFNADPSGATSPARSVNFDVSPVELNFLSIKVLVDPVSAKPPSGIPKESSACQQFTPGYNMLILTGELGVGL
jgi:hypothetical protein